MRTMEGNYVEIEIKYDMFPNTLLARVISAQIIRLWYKELRCFINYWLNADYTRRHFDLIGVEGGYSDGSKNIFTFLMTSPYFFFRKNHFNSQHEFLSGVNFTISKCQNQMGSHTT